MNSDDIELDYKGIIKPGQGTTPLHMAAWQGKIPAVVVLLRDGAEVNAKDNKGRTPFDYAMKSEHYHTALFLLENGAEAPRIEDINILLACAFRLKNFVKIQMLVEKYHANPNMKDDLDWTILHWAVYKGESNLVICLLNDSRINVNAVTNQKLRAFDFAKQQLKAASAYQNPDPEYTPLFTEERKRNHGKIIELFKKHDAKRAAFTVMLMQKRVGTIFHAVPKDVAKVIAKMVMRK